MPDFLKKYGNTFAVIATMLAIIAVFFVLYAKYYEVSDLATRPFLAEVWGTVSDWMMVFVTIITGLLIWNTFRLQLKSQNDQNSLLKIELSRRVDEILPIFRFINLISNNQIRPNSYLLQLHSNNLVYEIEVDVKLLNIHETFYNKTFSIPYYYPNQGLLNLTLDDFSFFNNHRHDSQLSITLKYYDGLKVHQYDSHLSILLNENPFVERRDGPTPVPNSKNIIIESL